MKVSKQELIDHSTALPDNARIILHSRCEKERESMKGLFPYEETYVVGNVSYNTFQLMAEDALLAAGRLPLS